MENCKFYLQVKVHWLVFNGHKVVYNIIYDKTSIFYLNVKLYIFEYIIKRCLIKIQTRFVWILFFVKIRYINTNKFSVATSVMYRKTKIKENRCTVPLTNNQWNLPA